MRIEYSPTLDFSILNTNLKIIIRYKFNMIGIREMCMSSEEQEEEEDNETLGPFFETHYSRILNFLPPQDIKMMSTLNQKWNERVESHKIWNSLLGALQGNKKTKPKQQETAQKKVAEQLKTNDLGSKQTGSLIKESKMSTNALLFWILTIWKS